MSPTQSRGLIDGSDEVVRRARALGFWLYVVLGLAALAHLTIPDPGGGGTLARILGVAYGWWIAVGFVWLQVALGRRLLDRWLESAFGGGDALALLLARLVAGYWITTVVLMVLAGLRRLDWPWLSIYLAGAAVVLLLPLRIDWRELRERALLPLDRQTWVAVGLATAVLLAWLPFFLQSLLPNSDWDGASTHLPLGIWLRDQGLGPIDLDHGHLIIPGSVHLCYAALQAVGAEQGIIPLNLMISILTCVAAGTIAARFWGRKAGIWALFVCLSTNLLLELGLDPRIDGFLGLFSAVAALGFLVWFSEQRRTGALVVSATALGMALGTKYTAVFPLLLWGAPVVWRLLVDRACRKDQARSGLALALCCLFVPAGFWYASNALRFGDPIYPRLRSELVESVDGRHQKLTPAVHQLMAGERSNPDFQGALSRTLSSPPQHSPPKTLLNPVSLFLRPEAHGRKPAHTLSPALLAFFLLPWTDRRRVSWYLMWMGLSVFLAIGALTGLARYAVPVYPIFAAGAGAAISGLRTKWWRLAWGVVVLAVLTANVAAEWRKVQVRSCGAWLGGDEDRVEWLRTVGYNGSVVLPNVIHDINERNRRGFMPYDGSALLLGEGKTHLFPIEAIPDTSRTGYPWLARLVRHQGDLAAVHQDLWSNGVRYVLVNVGYFDWVRNNTRVDQERLVYSLFELQQFQRAFGLAMYDEQGFLIFRLAPPAGARER
jgi:hypothetical protein